MTGRRAVGGLLQRAARGVGLDGAAASPVLAAVAGRRQGDCGTAEHGGSGGVVGDNIAGQRSPHAPSPSSFRDADGPPPLVQASRALSTLGASTSALASSASTPAAAMRFPSSSFSFPLSPCGAPPGASFASFASSASTAAAAVDASAADTSTDHGSSSSGGGFGGSSNEVLMLRGQLMDSLVSCLGLQQLDALLARAENREAFDELLLLTALDVTHRFCNSAAAATSTLLPSSLSSLSSSAASASSLSSASLHKSTAESAADVLTRMAEMLIRLLSEPDGLSPEGAVAALRTLAMLKFNPAGDYAGLQTMAAFYREAVLPALNPATAPPELAARCPQLLVDLFFAFARLFEVSAKRERELQEQLQMAQLAEEEAAARQEDDEQGSAAAAGTYRAAAAAAAAAAGSVRPWQQLPAGGLAAGSMVVGDRQLYDQISQLLTAPGMLTSMPSKTLGTLATAMATSRFLHYPLANNIANSVVLRLQAATSPTPAAYYDVVPTSSDAMATSTLSNILSCLAKRGFEHEAMCDATANWMLRHMTSGGSGSSMYSNRTPGGGASSRGVESHHIVDVAVAFARVKYDNTDFMLRASSTLQLKLPQASPNSVAMMAWAVANSKSGRSGEFEPLLNALAQRMVALRRNARGAGGVPGGGPGGAAVVPRHLACITVAMGRLGLRNKLLLDCVEQDVVTRADSYQARQLASVLRAFTLLDSYSPDLFAAAAAVLQQRLQATAGMSTAELEASPPAPPHVFGPQNYADIAWSVALAGHAPQVPVLMELLANRVAEVAPRLGKACLVRAAQAFAVAGVNDPRVFEALAEASRPLLVDLGPTYLATLVDAFTEVQHPVTERFWMACMDAVGLKAPHMERPLADMAAAAARLARAFRRHPASADYPECRNHYVLPLLEALAPEQALGSGPEEQH